MVAVSNRPLDAAQAGRFRQAMTLLQSGQQAQALVIAEALAAQAPNAADAWQLLGMCLAENDSYAEVDVAFERAFALLPGNAMLSRNYGMSLARYGRALREQGRWDAAEPVLRKVLARIQN